MKNLNIKAFLIRNVVWLFAAAGCIVLWILMGIYGNGISFKSLADNAYTASFLAIAGLAQMLVVTTGRGAIDMSIPGMITLGAYLSMGICNGKNDMILPALLAVIGVGILVGFFNSLMVIYLGIPAIITTMAMNYIIVTLTMLINHSFNVFTIPTILKDFVGLRIAGIPLMIIVVILLAVLVNILLKSTAYGKSLLAMGQNRDAARLAGVRVIKIEIITYIIASVLSGFSGALISARVTGAYLGMGDNYQMESIACIVVGGTLMSGGRANAAGTLVGSLFLYLMLQSMVKGALIVFVLLIGASENTDWIRKSRKNKFAGSQG